MLGTRLRWVEADEEIKSTSLRSYIVNRRRNSVSFWVFVFCVFFSSLRTYTENISSRWFKQIIKWVTQSIGSRRQKKQFWRLVVIVVASTLRLLCTKQCVCVCILTTTLWHRWYCPILYIRKRGRRQVKMSKIMHLVSDRARIRASSDQAETVGSFIPPDDLSVCSPHPAAQCYLIPSTAGLQHGRHPQQGLLGAPRMTKPHPYYVIHV